MVFAAQELYVIGKVAAPGMGNKKIATTLGLPQSTTKRWLQRLRSDGEMVSRNVGRPCSAEVRVSCFPLFSSHISRIARDLCVCSVI